MDQRTPNHLQINYLARRYADDLPLVSPDDSLQSTLILLNAYYEVMDRSESLASNLGAKPLGAMIVKRFERMFDGAPKVMGGRSQEASTTVATWLDIVDLAASTLERYTMLQDQDGSRVCELEVKGQKVHINEEDWLMVKSGLPQKMIPPQPIAEDEEKELGTLEILEGAVAQISHLADQGQCDVVFFCCLC